MSFTAHNIVLPDGSSTYPELGLVMNEHPWFLSARRLIDTVFPLGFDGVTLADLGCLEGGYTVEFAKLGLDAFGIEVRQANFENCEFVRASFALPNLAFVKDDVWNLPAYGVRDITFCCGLLYHLDRPREFLAMAGKCTRRMIIVQSHFAPDEQSDTFELSPIVENEGLLGRWYREYQGAFDPVSMEKNKWSSWKNDRSFWLKRDSLLQAISDAGFDIVLEQFDALGSNIISAMGKEGPYGKHHRGTFVGIKSGTP